MTLLVHSKMVREDVLKVILVALADFSSFWAKPAIVDCVLRPTVFVKHAPGFMVVIDGVGEQKLVKFIEILMEFRVFLLPLGSGDCDMAT